jgi:hypothetical protein
MRTKIIALILCTLCVVSVAAYLLIMPKIAVHDGNKVPLSFVVDTSDFLTGKLLIRVTTYNNSTMTLYNGEMQFSYLMTNGQWNTTVVYLGIVDVFNPQAYPSANSNIVSRTFYCPTIGLPTYMQYDNNGTRIDPFQGLVQVSAYGWTKP